jgi:hypothetical protein
MILRRKVKLYRKIYCQTKQNRLKLTFIEERGVAQPGSVTRLGRGGRRFESSHPDHSLMKL